jgi:hypothetical protein
MHHVEQDVPACMRARCGTRWLNICAYHKVNISDCDILQLKIKTLSFHARVKYIIEDLIPKLIRQLTGVHNRLLRRFENLIKDLVKKI